METTTTQRKDSNKTAKTADKPAPESQRQNNPEKSADAGVPLYLQANHVQKQEQEEEEEEMLQPKCNACSSLLQRQPEEDEEEEELLQANLVQPKLTIGAVDDPLEREADEVANRVMRKPVASTIEGPSSSVSQLQRQTEEEEMLQTRSNESGRDGGKAGASGSFETSVNAMRGGGAELPASTRDFMEPRIGSDFSHVRVHDGGQADALNRDVSARAFTVGNNIFFGSGQYQPEAEQGRHLLAHELTHVMQQTGVRRKHAAGAPINVHRTVQRVQRESLEDEVKKELAEWAEKSKKTTDPKDKDYGYDLQEFAWTLITDPDPEKPGPLPKPKSKKARKAWEKKFKKAGLLAKMILAGGPKVKQKEARAALILYYMALAGFSAEAVKLTGAMKEKSEIENVYEGVLERIDKADPGSLTKITEYYIAEKGTADNPILEKFTTSTGAFEKKLSNAQMTAILKPLIKTYGKDAFLIDLLSETLLRKKAYRKTFSNWMWKEGKGEFLFKVLQSEYFIEPEYGPTVVADVGELKLEKDMPWVYANKQKYYVGFLVKLGKDAGVEIAAPKNLKFTSIKKWLDDNTDNIGEALAKKYPTEPERWIKVYKQIADIFFYHVDARNIKPDLSGKLAKLGPGAPAKLRLKADCDVFATYAMRFFTSVKDPANPDFKAFEPIGYMALDPKGDDGHAVALMRRDKKYYVINNKEVTALAISEDKKDAKKEQAIKAMRNDALKVYDEAPKAYKVYYADALAGGVMPKALASTAESTRREDLEP